jgi:hypothetical protein
MNGTHGFVLFHSGLHNPFGGGKEKHLWHSKQLGNMNTLAAINSFQCIKQQKAEGPFSSL